MSVTLTGAPSVVVRCEGAPRRISAGDTVIMTPAEWAALPAATQALFIPAVTRRGSLTFDSLAADFADGSLIQSLTAADSSISITGTATMPILAAKRARIDPTLSVYAGGMKFDGVTDDTAAFLAVLAAAQAAHGAVIELPQTVGGVPAVPALILGQIVLPNDGAVPVPSQWFTRITSAGGANMVGRGSGVVGGPGLDLRYGGASHANCGTTLGSSVVSDAAAAAANVGQFVIGAGMPDKAQVVAVTPGTSFVYTIPDTTKGSLTSSLVSGTVYTALPVAPLAAAIASGATILLGGGTTFQLLTTSGPAAPGATSIPVTSFTANANYTYLSTDQTNWAFIDLTAGAARATGTVPLTVTGAKINTYGIGTLEIDHIGLYDQGNSAAPFIHTTNTILNIHENRVEGNGSKSGLTCDQDIAILGGSTSVGSGSPVACFQGYATSIRKNYFNRVRRILAQTYVTEVWISENTWWQACGSSLATTPSTLTSPLTAGTPITALPVSALSKAVVAGDRIQVGVGDTDLTFSMVATASGAAAVGATSIPVNSITPAIAFATGTLVYNTTSGIGAMIESAGPPGQAIQLHANNNHFDMAGGYTHATRLSQASGCHLIGNDIQNTHPANIACHRFESTASYNLVIPSLTGITSGTLLDDQSPSNGGQTVIATNQGKASLFNQGIRANGTISQFTSQQAPKIVDSLGNSWQEVISGPNSRTNYVTPAGGSQTMALQLIRNSAAWFQLILGGTSTAQIGPTLADLLIQSANTSRIQLGDANHPNNINVLSGVLRTTHRVIIGGVPTIAAAGSSTALAIVGHDEAHNVTLTTAAGLAVDGAVCTVTFNFAYNFEAPGSVPCFSVFPKNGAAAAAQPFITGDTATSYQIALHNPPAGATTMVFDVLLVGR